MIKSVKVDNVSQIKELIGKSVAVYCVDYNGVDVATINEVRKEFRENGITYKVFKNTLFKRAASEIGGYEKFNEVLVGMSGFAFVEENVVAPAKVIKKFASKDKNKLVFKGCIFDSQFYGPDQLETLASMPTKEEIVAGILGSINAPASGIVGVLNSVMRDLVSVIDEVAKTKAA